MPVITQITTHVADAKARLLNQFKGKTIIEAILDADSQQWQELENALISMQALLDITTMIGTQLDNIGTILGEAREGATDAAYRTNLQARIAELYSSGEPESVITAFIRATSPTTMHFYPDYPAAFDLYGDGSQPTDLLNTIEDASPAGVRVGLLDFLEWDDSDGALWDDGDTIYVRYASSAG